ncbi:hypothetical protein ES705_00090 [subsurface metagenome]|nr:hypothetical protein [Clostridia bacterium]
METKAVIENGFKKTGIGLIPKDWEAVNIDRYVRFERGTEPGSANYNKEEKGTRFLRIVDMSGSRDDRIYTTSDNIKTCKGKDVLITFDGSPGVVRRGLAGAYSSGIRKILITSNNLALDYIYYVLQTRFVQETIKKYTTGVTIKHSSKVIPHIKIPLPLPAEQQKIASILSKIQQAIEQQDRIIETTKELKKSVMNKLFREGLHGEEQKETEIGLMPKSWGVVKLGEFKELITKGSSPRWQGFNYCDRGIIFVRSQNVGFGELLLNDTVYLPIKFNEKEKRSIIKANDILINLVGASIGRAAVATSNIEGGNLNQAVAIVRLKPSYFVPQFLMYYLLTDNGQRQIHLNKKEIARANISLQDVNNFIVPKPEGSEQVEIVNFLSSLDKKLSQADARKQALQALFRTMLNQLMTGRIRVKDLDIEVQNND